MTEENPILVEIKDRVAVITINRPDVLNALNIPTIQALGQIFDEVETNDDVRVIIFTGAGERAFVAGADIADINARQGLAHFQQYAEGMNALYRRIQTCDKPTIAAVNGWALGGGCELMMCLDIRLLAEGARIGLPEINIGLFPGAGGTQRGPRNMPVCRAKELMFTGDHITAEEAVTFGLANRVVPKDKLMEEALALAGRIAEKSPLTLKFLKRSMLQVDEAPLASGLAFEQAMIALVFDSEDAHEGCSAFLEKREAIFTGR